MPDANASTTPASSPDAPGAASATRSTQRTVAALVCGVHAVALAGFAFFYAYEIATGKATDMGPAVMSAMLIALFAGGLYSLARAWLGPETWQRNPSIVWFLLLLPVAYTALTSGSALVGVPIVLTAALGLWAAITTSSDRAPEVTGD